MIDPALFIGEGGTVFGEGRFGSEQWELVFFSESEAPRKHPDDHTGPGHVMFRYQGGACGRGPMLGLSSPFVEVDGMCDHSSPLTWVYGEVSPEFDSVRVSCADGHSVDAVLVECLDRFTFNYYVALLPERPTGVTATGKGVKPFTRRVSGWAPPTTRKQPS